MIANEFPCANSFDKNPISIKQLLNIIYVVKTAIDKVYAWPDLGTAGPTWKHFLQSPKFTPKSIVS